MYCIIDIETTGTSALTDKITEIAIIVHDGKKIIEEFVSLVNPECRIPYRITQITGINDAMVENAPKFYEIAKKIVQITENQIFVAHNVGFDYGFIRNEFKQLGYDFKREKLCTVRLSRKLMPGYRSYGLGSLCRELNIPNHDRHRALGDAMATTILFEKLLVINGSPVQLNLKGLNSSLSPELINSLPEEAGVYYFHNDAGDIIYIGKSRNIRDRVLQHLSNETTKKAVEMKNAAADITCVITGSDLVAQLLESEEIKKHLPKYNRSQRRTGYNFGLTYHQNDEGYLCLAIEKINGKQNLLTSFTSLETGKKFLYSLCDEHLLCQKLNALYKTETACFQYSIRLCHGACIGIEPPEEYNLRVQPLIDYFRFENDSFFVIDKGRRDDEFSVVKVEAGRYCGFGYIDTNCSDFSIPSLLMCINYHHDNRDVRQIIRTYIKRSNPYKIIPFNQLKMEFS